MTTKRKVTEKTTLSHEAAGYLGCLEEFNRLKTKLIEVGLWPDYVSFAWHYDKDRFTNKYPEGLYDCYFIAWLLSIDRIPLMYEFLEKCSDRLDWRVMPVNRKESMNPSPPKLNKHRIAGSDINFICSYCPKWAPGIECMVANDYRNCEKSLNWKRHRKIKA